MHNLSIEIATKESRSVIENSAGYKFLIIISMLYISIMLCNAILTNRYIGTDSFFVLGGSFTSPVIFILDDIIAEIYGYKITRFVILTGFAVQAFIVLVCQMVVNAPYPEFFTGYEAYSNILGSSLFRITLSGFAAYIIANLINSYIVTRWKILLKGKYFWLRSLGSSVFSEALYTFLAILMMELQSIPLQDILKVVLISFSIKAIYSAIFAVPGQMLVTYVKKITGIDVYEFPTKFTPFKYKNKNQELGSSLWQK